MWSTWQRVGGGRAGFGLLAGCSNERAFISLTSVAPLLPSSLSSPPPRRRAHLASPTPSSSSSPSDNRELHSSLHLSADSSPSLSSSSVRTPSPPSPNFARREPAVASGSSSFDNQSGFSTASTSSYNQEDESAGPSVVVMMLQDRYAGMSKDLWKPDGDAEVCDGEGCTTKFGLFSARKHHCRK